MLKTIVLLFGIFCADGPKMDAWPWDHVPVPMGPGPSWSQEKFEKTQRSIAGITFGEHNYWFCLAKLHFGNFGAPPRRCEAINLDPLQTHPGPNT